MEGLRKTLITHEKNCEIVKGKKVLSGIIMLSWVELLKVQRRTNRRGKGVQHVGHRRKKGQYSLRRPLRGMTVVNNRNMGHTGLVKKNQNF